MGRRALTGADLRQRPLGLIGRVRAAIRRTVIAAFWMMGLFTTMFVGVVLLVGCLANQSKSLPAPPASSVPVASVAPIQPPTVQIKKEALAETIQPASFLVENTEPIPNSDTHIWIKPYTKLDGTFVEGHWRKKTDVELRGKKEKKEKAPKVAAVREDDEPTYSGSSGGGTVYVKGYTKKNGTYVAPHTRSSPRRK